MLDRTHLEKVARETAQRMAAKSVCAVDPEPILEALVDIATRALESAARPGAWSGCQFVTPVIGEPQIPLANALAALDGPKGPDTKETP